jgi:hypothetical protein
VRAFLSYSRSDRAFIDRFAGDLGRAGIEIWCDVDALRGGEEWRTQIVDAIEQSDVFLLFVSPASMQSDNVRRELTVAEEESKRIVPVLMQVTAIPDDFRYSLAGVHYTDIAAMDYDHAFAAVRDALTDEPKAEVPSAPPTPRDTKPSRIQGKTRRRSVIIAVVALGVLVAVIALARGGRGGGSNGNTTSAPPGNSASPASSQAATVSVNKRFGYGAFAITLGTATFSGHTLRIDAQFENLAPNAFQIDPSHLAVVYRGNSYGWSGDPVPNVGGNAKASGTLVFSIFGPFDLEKAMLVAGRGEQNQAVVPLAGHGTARLLEPRAEPITGAATAGTLTVKIVGGLVAAGNFQYNDQATKDKVVVHLELEAGTTEQYGDNFLGDHLVLEVPNGEQVTPIGGSNEVLTAGGTTAGMFADFEVLAPAIGNFVLVVRQQANTAEIPFTLS